MTKTGFGDPKLATWDTKRNNFPKGKNMYQMLLRTVVFWIWFNYFAWLFRSTGNGRRCRSSLLFLWRRHFLTFFANDVVVVVTVVAVFIVIRRFVNWNRSLSRNVLEQKKKFSIMIEKEWITLTKDSFKLKAKNSYNTERSWIVEVFAMKLGAYQLSLLPLSYNM